MDDDEAKCPLKGCGEPLHLVVSLLIPIDGAPGTRGARDAINDDWEVVCMNDHRLDSGSNETDGRSIPLGYRSGQSLGGVR